MTIKKNSLAITLSCYILWGILPAYWNLLADVNPFLILCCRIVFAFLFMICFLFVSGKLQTFKDTITNKTTMCYLIPAALLIAFNWGLYIWAVNNGRVLDGSLGYYMNPLIAFLLGVVLFREKYLKLQLVAVALAFTGVIISLIAFGNFPVVAISLALSFAVYGVLKKKAHADPAASIAVESLIVAPFALIFPFLFLTDSIASVNITGLLLLIGGGVLTAIPLFLYARAVNDIPFIIVGFFQYISPSLALTYGLITGEKPSGSQLVSFIFIGLGLIVFSIALIRRVKDSSVAQADTQKVALPDAPPDAQSGTSSNTPPVTQKEQSEH